MSNTDIEDYKASEDIVLACLQRTETWDNFTILIDYTIAQQNNWQFEGAKGGEHFSSIYYSTNVGNF